MRDVYYIRDLAQAKTLLKPQRVEVLKQLGRPRTCAELASHFNETPQRMNYHLKALENAGLVEKVEERPTGGRNESVYQASAVSYWMAPKLIGKIGGRRTTRDQISLKYLLALTEEVQEDVGRLGEQSGAGKDIPSLSMSAQIYLPDGDRRAAFLTEVQETFQQLARSYGLPGDAPQAKSETFRLVLACYPKAA
jgi:DNA-binding transcriptional ArsR family regulator